MIEMKIEHGQPERGKLVYRDTEYAFDTKPRPETCGASFTINELELMLDDEERQRVLFVAGYCPHSGWRPAVLNPRVAGRGLLRGFGTRVTAGGAIALNSRDDRWPVLVDGRSGWIRLGRGSPDGDGDGTEFAPGALAVLEGDRLVALWLHPERLPHLPR